MGKVPAGTRHGFQKTPLRGSCKSLILCEAFGTCRDPDISYYEVLIALRAFTVDSGQGFPLARAM